MRGINQVAVSGNLKDDPRFSTTGSGAAACSFTIACERPANGETVTAWIKINVYGEALVRICRSRLRRGEYVLVTGELMNRFFSPEGGPGRRSDEREYELTEVRARDLVFLPTEARSAVG